MSLTGQLPSVPGLGKLKSLPCEELNTMDPTIKTAVNKEHIWRKVEKYESHSHDSEQSGN